MKNLRLLFVFSFLLLSIQNLFAQDVYTSSGKPVNRNRKAANDRTGFDPDKMIYGGGITLGYGSVGRSTAFQIGASPFVGYRITDNFMAGVGIGYQYQSIKDFYQSPTGQLYPARLHFVSPSVWTRFGVSESIFLQGELEYNFLNYNQLAFDGSGNVVNQRKTISSPALLLGGGLRQRISDRTSLLIAILYNVLGNSNQDFNPYPGNIVFRTGISIGY